VRVPYSNGAIVAAGNDDRLPVDLHDVYRPNGTVARGQSAAGLARVRIPYSNGAIIAARNDHWLAINRSPRQRFDTWGIPGVAGERFPAGLARAGVPHSKGVGVAAGNEHRLLVNRR